jgi:hypothetical protein
MWCRVYNVAECLNFKILETSPWHQMQSCAQRAHLMQIDNGHVHNEVLETSPWHQMQSCSQGALVWCNLRMVMSMTFMQPSGPAIFFRKNSWGLDCVGLPNLKHFIVRHGPSLFNSGSHHVKSIALLEIRAQALEGPRRELSTQSQWSCHLVHTPDTQVLRQMQIVYKCCSENKLSNCSSWSANCVWSACRHIYGLIDSTSMICFLLLYMGIGIYIYIIYVFIVDTKHTQVWWVSSKFYLVSGLAIRGCGRLFLGILPATRKRETSNFLGRFAFAFAFLTN